MSADEGSVWGRGEPEWRLGPDDQPCGVTNETESALPCDLPAGHPIGIAVRLRADWVVEHQDHASREHRVAWVGPYSVKRPSEWAALKGIRVVSPDGWHAGTVAGFPGRKGVKKRISEREFDARAAVSTIEMIKTEEAQMAEPYPKPEDAPEGEAYRELVTLLSELVSVHLPTSPSHSEVEAVIALAGLVRNERGLTDVDPQDDPGPEELRVQGARRFVDWLEERNLLRSREDDQWAGFPGTAQGLVTSWLNVERQVIEREDDPVSTTPKVEVFIGDKKLEPDCQHQIELLRAELSRATHRAVMFNQVLAERDDLKRTLESVKDERDQANAQTTKLAGAHQDGIRRALALGRREGRAEVQQAKPADAVWDFLDWLQGKGWELSTEWPVGPGDETYAISAKPGSEDQKGLVDGWYWARHGQWEHERGQEPTEAPGDDETETTETPEPGSFAYEHEETDRG